MLSQRNYRRLSHFQSFCPILPLIKNNIIDIKKRILLFFHHSTFSFIKFAYDNEGTWELSILYSAWRNRKRVISQVLIILIFFIFYSEAFIYCISFSFCKVWSFLTNTCLIMIYGKAAFECSLANFVYWFLELSLYLFVYDLVHLLTSFFHFFFLCVPNFLGELINLNTWVIWWIILFFFFDVLINSSFFNPKCKRSLINYRLWLIFLTRSPIGDHSIFWLT